MHGLRQEITRARRHVPGLPVQEPVKGVFVEFYNERRPSPRRDDDDRPLDRAALLDANTRLRNSTPAYRQEALRVKIRTAAVQRHRARKSGKGDFQTVGEYLNFMTGADDG